MKRYKVTHIMNTKQLGLMLVAGLLSFGASAQVDLNPNTMAMPPETHNTVLLASENTIGMMGTDVSGTEYDVDGEAGFIIPSGSTYYGRIDLGGGAEFGTAVADNFDISGATVARASGGMNTGSVILSLNATTTVAVDEGWDLDNVTYKLNGKATVSFTYRLYESATDAIAGGTNQLSSQSAPLVMFADATSMAGAATDPPQIDVATSSVKYEAVGSVPANSTTHIMSINIANVMGDQLALGANAADLTLEDVVASITLTATGNFTAVAAVTEGGPAGKVWLDRDAECTPAHAAVENDDTTADVDETMAARNDNLGLAVVNEAGLEAVVTLTNAADDTTTSDDDVTHIFGAITGAHLCMETNGVSEIPEGSYTGILSMTAATTYAAIANASITGSTLEKNSESANLEFLLTPKGTFRNYVRLTNTSNVQGSNLMVTLINDAGDQVSFSLSDAGISDELAPRASTPLININALYEAAQAVDRGMDADDMPIAAFTVTGGEYGNKLRAKFEGSVLEDSLEAQALSVSTDNTTFFTF